MPVERSSRANSAHKHSVAERVTAAFPKQKKSDYEGVLLRVAVYARYSTDGQKETSIDDQIRCCRETARRYGFEVSDDLIFVDDAITGSAKGTHKRERYHALREAVRDGLVDVIICDQQCRLARSAKEALTFFEELKDHKVRLLTADGFDSEQATSQLLFGIKSVFSEFFLDETRHRVRRGMIGEFDRGAMVTSVPYGYQIDVMRTATEGRCQWAINPVQAEVVREIFRWRKEGMSLSQIGGVLNGRGVPTSRDVSREKGIYWRAAAVWRLLQNPIYKGVYVVNFSGERNGEGAPEVGQRIMADLALVSVEDWDVCQSKGMRSPSGVEGKLRTTIAAKGTKGVYGGGKHPLSGVLRCGVCGAPLSCHKRASDRGHMHCIQCEHATNVGVPGRQPLYVSVYGVRQMLRWLLEKVVSGEAVIRYQECLRERLLGGEEGELIAARQELGKAERSRERIGRLLRQVGEDDPILEREFIKAREDILVLERRVREIENGLQAINHEAVQKQLTVDLSVVVDRFLSDELAPGRTRALLNRIFPSIVLKGKLNRYIAIFRVEVKPGALLAEASDTAELVKGNEVMWVRLTTSGSKCPEWSVEEIEPLDDALTAA